jgi:thiamine biosynthesis lipoprotein
MRLTVPEVDPRVLDGRLPGARVVVLSGTTMGTSWYVRIAHPSEAVVSPLRASIQACLDELVRQMSHWTPESVLGRFNRAPPRSWTALPSDFAAVMSAAMEVADASSGAFDPAIGALVNLWGFGPPGAMPQPSAAAIEQALAHSGWQRLTFDRSAQRIRQPGGLQLDLSGIAKGYAVDRVVQLLGEHDIRHALVEVGGELRGVGIRPDGDPWWVDVETPVSGVQPLRVALHQLAIATSGDYVRGRHTIDPRTGRPVKHVCSVSVVHASAMLADAWATALGTMLHEEMAQAAGANDLCVRALLRTHSGMTEWISPALQALM